MDFSAAVKTYTGEPNTSEADQPTIELAEHDESEPLKLSDADQTFLEKVADDGPLGLTYTSTGQPRISTSRYVGVAALPSGRRIEVTPKQTVSRLLDLLQYALDVPSDTVSEETALTGAETFIDAFGALFTAKLRQLLARGIRRSYTRVESVESAVRGRLDIQRQLQRPTPVPTDFAVEYDTLTANTTSNQAILAATQVLTQLVGDDKLAGTLARQATQLRKLVEPAYVTSAEIDAIETTRLNAYYEDLLTLSRLVLERRFFEDLTSGAVASFGLFINMETVYEAVIERAATSAIERIKPTWEVKGQGSLDALIEGPHAVGMRPDVVVRNTSGDVRLVADAKWKTGGDSAGDVYQLTSYMLAEGVPGMLVYPQQDTSDRESHINGRDGHVLRSVHLPTAADVPTPEVYIDTIVSAFVMHLKDLLELPTPDSTN